MLAFPPKFVPLIVGGLFALHAVVGSSQDLPSSRYQPVQYNFSDHGGAAPQQPPSVHIPPAGVRTLPTHGTPTNGPPANAQERGMIRQTSYAQEPTQMKTEPSVPEILQRTTREPAAATALAAPQAPPRQAMLPVNLPNPSQVEALLKQTAQDVSQSPAQFANQMNQLRQSVQVSDPAAQLKSSLDAMKVQAAEQTHAAVQQTENSFNQMKSAAVTSAENSLTKFTSAGLVPQVQDQNASVATHPTATPSTTANPTVTNPPAAETAAFGAMTESWIPGQQPATTGEAPAANAPPQANANPVAVPRDAVRDFMGSINGAAANSNHDPRPLANVRDPEVAPAAAQHDFNITTQQARSVESQTANDERLNRNSAIRLEAPSLSVESFGPQSIGINRPATYKVVVTNETSRIAERVMVSIDMPAWVEIDKVNQTSGERQFADSNDAKEKTKLVWKIDQVPANGSQTITITTIPRKAEAFDLGIEWTLAPRAGAANIVVTQPKLEMSIVGPDEVHFGENALYEVTLRNTGNGDAEDVILILPEALGGDRAPLGKIPAGASQTHKVEVLARMPGELDMALTAVSENQAEVAASRKLMIRRANLGINIAGPALRYAGTSGQYVVTLTNTGDAAAVDVVAALGLPSGVKYLGGIETFNLIDGGIRWPVGRIEPGQSREYKVNCKFDTSGELQLEAGTKANGELQAAHACVTRVQTIADLAMVLNDPAGPLTTGEEITYEIVVQNRGTKSANDVDVWMIFSEGLEPKSGSGREYRIPRDGAIQFATIPQIDPGQSISMKVNAVAFAPGTHVFRAELQCKEADAREIKEGTSKFFGEEVGNPSGTTANKNSSFATPDFK